MPLSHTLLIIDDEAQIRTLFQTALEGAGYRVLTAENGPDGLRLVQEHAVDLVLVDIFMPGMDGLELIPHLRKVIPRSKIIAISGGTGDWNYLAIAKHLGAHEALRKPLTLEDLLSVVEIQLRS